MWLCAAVAGRLTSGGWVLASVEKLAIVAPVLLALAVRCRPADGDTLRVALGVVPDVMASRVGTVALARVRGVAHVAAVEGLAVLVSQVMLHECGHLVLLVRPAGAILQEGLGDRHKLLRRRKQDAIVAFS